MAINPLIYWIKRHLWLCILVYSTAIFILSAMPQPPAPEPVIPYQDKLLHIVLYFIYALLWQLALVRVKDEKIRRYATPIAVVIAVIYGATNEIYQSYTPGRDCDFWDVIANAVGAVLVNLRKIYQ